MAQRQFRSDDTSVWEEGFGTGSDGSLTVSVNSSQSPIDSACTGSGITLSATNASFASGQYVLIHQTRGTGMGNWELNRIASYTTGTISLKYPLTNTYNSGAQVLVIPTYTSVTINSGVTYSAKAYDGTVGGILAWFCNGTSSIVGTINAAGLGLRAGSAIVGNGVTGYAGENQTRNFNGAAVTTRENNSGGGGRYGQSGSVSPGAGAGGGNGTAGATGGGGETGVISESGNAAGNAGLTSMFFGGAAGGGGGIGDGGYSGAGGNGGGIIAIFSKDLQISGAVTINGGYGGNGTYAAGGGGAGGSVLLKAQTATLGTNKFNVSGGAGGTSSKTFGTGGNGGAGGVGRIHLDYLTSYSGSASPTAVDVRQDNTLFARVVGNSFFFNFV